MPHSQELVAPKRAHFKQGGDLGAVVGVWATKPDRPTEIIIRAVQSPWKQLLQKTKQVGKTFRKQRQSLEAVSALACLEMEPFHWIFFFFQWLFHWCLFKSDHFWNLKDLFLNHQNFSYPPKIHVFSWTEFSINKRPSETLKTTLIQSFNKRCLKRLIVFS